MVTGNDGVQIVQDQNPNTSIVPIMPVNPPVVQAVANVPVSAPVTVVKGEKPEKFNG